MKVAQLAKLLDGIVTGLDGLVTNTNAREACDFTNAMAVFKDASLPEFIKFFREFGDEFQKSGKISAQGKISVAGGKGRVAPRRVSGITVDEAVASFNSIFDPTVPGDMTEVRVEEMLRPLNGLKVPDLADVLNRIGISERPKTKAQMIEKIRILARNIMESRYRADSAGR